MTPELARAIDALVPFGPDAAPNATRVVRMVQALLPSVPNWSLVAALTDYTPRGLTAYGDALTALSRVGVTPTGNGAWLSPWPMW